MNQLRVHCFDPPKLGPPVAKVHVNYECRQRHRFTPLNPKSFRPMTTDETLTIPSLRHCITQNAVSIMQNTTSGPQSAVEKANRNSIASIGMMAKYWTPGTVKTRLGASIGLEKSARLHELFVMTLARSLGRWSHSQPIRLVAVVTPDDKQAAFQSAIDPTWTTQLQADGDLGNRMQQWFLDTLRYETDSSAEKSDQFSDKAILIGADCPTIDTDVIFKATQLLDDHELVLGPAVDGGYYLIALRGPWRKEFETLFANMTWSTDDVLAITQQRASDAGIKVALLQPREDVDTVEVLDRLRSDLSDRAASDPDSQRLLQGIASILADNPDEPHP